MEHPKFLSSAVYTSFIDENPQLFDLKPSQNRAQKLLNYIGDVLVNGPSTPLVTDIPPAEITVATPETPAGNVCCTKCILFIRSVTPIVLSLILSLHADSKDAQGRNIFSCDVNYLFHACM